MGKPGYIDVKNMTPEEKNILQNIANRDDTSQLVIMYLTNGNSKYVRKDVIELLENNSFESNENFSAAEILFSQMAPIEWLELVMKVIHEKEESQVKFFIREIAKAYKHKVPFDMVQACVNEAQTPSELHEAVAEKEDMQKSYDQAMKTIKDVPGIVNQMVNDNDEKTKNLENLINEKNERIAFLEKEVEKKNIQLQECTEKSNDTVSKSEYEKLQKNCNYYKNKYDACLIEKKSLKNQILKLKDELNNKSTVKEEKVQVLDEIKLSGLVEDKIALILAENYKKLNELVQDNANAIKESVSNEIKESKNGVDTVELITEVKNCITENFEKLHVTVPENNKPEEKSLSADEMVSEEQHDTYENEELNEVNESIEYSGEGYVPENIIFEDENQQEIEMEPYGEVNSEEYVEAENNEPKTESKVEEFKTKDYPAVEERNTSICVAPELLDNKILTSTKKDVKENEKISFLSKLKFRISNPKKQNELIISLMMKKRYSMEMIKCVKTILISGNVQRKLLFELINKNDTTLADLNKLREFATAVEG